MAVLSVLVGEVERGAARMNEKRPPARAASVGV
jgi:hypothetical protein